MKYFLGFLGVVALIVLVFVLVLGGLNRGKKNTPKQQAIVLTDYANTSTVMRLTIDGPVVADQNHVAIRITIGRDQNMIEQIKGYQDTVVKQQTYGNNQQAYNTFLRSLQLFNFTKGDASPNLANETGFCPLGDRFIYEIDNGADTVQRYWTSTCGGGTFKGSGNTIRSLFRAQIPNYYQFVSGTGLQ